MTDVVTKTGSLDTANVDLGRRRFLNGATSVVGGAGVAALAYAFLATMSPSERARAAGAPVDVDISKLVPGQKVTIEWRGKPVWIVRRTQEALMSLEKVTGQLADPASEMPQQPGYIQESHRALNPEYLVMVGVCTHLGCSPTFRPDVGAPDLGSDWQGGFFCPCHGSKFDFSGRVYKSMPAPKNLVIPPYRYIADATIRVGEDPSAEELST